MTSELVKSCIKVVMPELEEEDVDLIVDCLAGMDLNEADLGEEFLCKAGLTLATSVYMIRVEELAELDGLPSPGLMNHIAPKIGHILEGLKNE